MRPMAIAAVTLATFGLIVTLAMPGQARTTFPTAVEAQTVDGAEAAREQPAGPNHVKQVCVRKVAVKRHGRVIGHLYKAQTFKVIRKVHDEFGFEVVGYYGFAYGDVNARGKVRAGAFGCH